MQPRRQHLPPVLSSDSLLHPSPKRNQSAVPRLLRLQEPEEQAFNTYPVLRVFHPGDGARGVPPSDIPQQRDPGLPGRE